MVLTVVENLSKLDRNYCKYDLQKDKLVRVQMGSDVSHLPFHETEDAAQCIELRNSNSKTLGSIP